MKLRIASIMKHPCIMKQDRLWSSSFVSQCLSSTNAHPLLKQKNIQKYKILHYKSRLIILGRHVTDVLQDFLQDLNTELYC